MNKKMRILHILATDRYSGAENVGCQIINLCKNEDIEFYYCSPRGPIENTLKEKQINYYPIESLTKKNIANVIKELKPDIIHTHDRRATLRACLCFNNIPIISHLHGKFEDMKKISINNIIYSLTAIRAKKIICVSNSIKKEWNFSKYFEKKIIVKRNVISINVANYNNEKIKYDICFVGRLVYEKDIPRLIRILTDLKECMPSFTAVICGDGNEREFLINAIKTNNLEGNVEFLGFVNDPLKYIAQSRVMIMTSRTEGTPMAALECLSLGKPIVSTPTDGLIEIIKNNKNGYLSNNDNELVLHIKNLLENECLYRELVEGVKNENPKINNFNDYAIFFINLYKLITN